MEEEKARELYYSILEEVQRTGDVTIEQADLLDNLSQELNEQNI